MAADQCRHAFACPPIGLSACAPQEARPNGTGFDRRFASVNCFTDQRTSGKDERKEVPTMRYP